MANTFFGRLRGKASTGSPSILLAAFGKHPSFDDHIPPNLQQHPRLIELYEQLYDHGIRKLVDSGRWTELEKAGAIEPFNHLLLARHDDEAIVGRLWASRDSVGRDKYPFVICAVCVGIPLATAIDEVLPRLRALEQACLAAKTREQLDAAVESARTELKTIETQLPANPATSSHQSALRELAHAPQLGPDAVGLMRVMYQAEYELSGFRPGATGSGKSRQLRVPGCGSDPVSSARLWLDLLAGLLDPAAPVLALAPLERNWIDLIVGAPTDEQLFVLRSGAQTTPLVTDIPYPLEPAFIEKCQAMIEGRTITQPVPPASPPAAAVAPATMAARISAPAPPSPPAAGNKTRFIVGGAAIAAIVIAAAAYRMTRAPANPPVAISQTPATPIATPATPPPPAATPNLPPATVPPPLPPDPRIAWSADAKMKKLHSDAEPLHDTDFDAALSAADDDLQKLTALPWTASAASSITRAKSNLDTKISTLDRRLAILENARALLQARQTVIAHFQNRRLDSSILQSAWNRDWSELRSDSTLSPASLRSRAERIWAYLHGIDCDPRFAIPTLTFSSDPPLPDLQNVLQQLAAQKRDQAMSGALAPHADLAALAQNYSASVQRLRAFNRHWQTVASLLAAGIDPADAHHIPGAPAVSDQPIDSDLLHSSAIAQTLGNLPAALARLRQLDHDDASQLISLAGNPAEPPAVRLAAWRRLGSDGRWPASLESFRQDSDARLSIVAALQSPRAADWQQNWINATQKEMDQQERLRWRSAFLQSLKSAGEKETDVAAVVKNFSTAARTDSSLAIPSSLLRGLTVSGAAPSRQTTLSGPPASWRQNSQQQGKIVSFRWKHRELRFDLLMLPDGQAVYLLENEVPLGTFIDVFNAANQSNTVKFDVPLNGGPCGWKTYDLYQLNVADNWWDHLVPRSTVTAVPSEDAPMQYITPELAIYWAGLLGCRLPTLAEWNAAAQSEQASASIGTAPSASGKWLKGVFSLSATASDWTPENADSPFAPVRDSSDSSPGFHHLLGNVAEFVYGSDSARDFENWSASAHPASLEAIHKYLSVHQKEAPVQVIGGSNFSPPDVNPKKPQSSTLRVGYADVGFRLVFPAQTPSLENRVREILVAFGKNDPAVTP